MEILSTTNNYERKKLLSVAEKELSSKNYELLIHFCNELCFDFKFNIKNGKLTDIILAKGPQQAIYYDHDTALTSKLHELKIPNFVTKIGECAFAVISKKKYYDEVKKDMTYSSITIPKSVTDIGYRAFAGQTNLHKIQIPNSVKHLGGNILEDNTKCIKITMPNTASPIYQEIIESYRESADRNFKFAYDDFWRSKFSSLNEYKNAENIKNERISICEELQQMRQNGQPYDTDLLKPMVLQYLGATPCASLSYNTSTKGIDSITNEK